MPARETSEFLPVAPDASGIVSWIHLGDLHMVRRGEQNHRDLLAIVEEINRTFAGKGISFVYLPGDIADDGSASAYQAVRECLDRLTIPWCGIVGDHDVHEKSFTNFQRAISKSLYSSFDVGGVRFFRLNTFAEPRPDSFLVDEAQLDWLERELQLSANMRTVVLMHCYPSDLKQGGARLTQLLQTYRVSLVDMGHTHYNELSNDGLTLYSATRSTGQIEEGPVGYTVISMDGDAVSWQFQRLGTPALVSITRPSDLRLLTRHGAQPVEHGKELPVRLCVWGSHPPDDVVVDIGGARFRCDRLNDFAWQAAVPAIEAVDGVHELTASALSAEGVLGTDRIRIAVGKEAVPPSERAAVDQENAVGAWLDRDILGTQLGPNKNGKKW